MVSTSDAARAVAAAFLAQNVQAPVGHELVVTEVSEYEHCWVATYNTRSFVETGDFRAALAGNGPLVINRRTGDVRQGVSRLPVEAQLDAV